MSKYCRKITADLNDVADVCKLYLLEEEITLSEKQLDNYIFSAQNVYLKILDNGSYTYGCFQEKELIGVINVNKNWDFYPGYEDNPYVHLETFIVKREYQNNNIGTFLLESVIQMLKQEGVTYIIMQSDNEYVKRISQKVGLTDHSYDMRIDFVK